MAMVNIHEAKTNLSRLVARSERGEETLIARNGKPVARLVPVAPDATSGERELGFMRGVIVLPDDFDEDHPDIVDAIYADDPADPLT
jgi:prevent-host-death family protein